jgi:chemotaxis methyl-accepting protein methylase
MQMFSHQNSALAKKIPFVVAKDYDSEVISMAKTGKLPMQGYEFEKIQKYTGGNFDKFFNRNQCEEFVGKNSIDIPLKKEFFDKIKFSVADVTEDCQNIEGKNSIVFIRNFLPYLKSKQVISKLASDLGEQLKSGSLVAVGNFDKKGLAHHRINLDEILDISGFTQTEVPNLYKKV